MFHEVIVSLLPSLAKDYQVYVLLLRDSYTRDFVIEELESFRESGVVQKYWIVPIHNDKLQLIRDLRRRLQELRSFEFKIMMAGNECEPVEQFLFKCIASEKCIQVIFWQQVTYLFENERLTRRLIGDKAATGDSDRTKVPLGRLRLFERIRKDTVSLLILKIYRFLRARVRRLCRPIIEYYARVLLPRMFLGCTFRMNAIDRLTQIGSGRSHAYIFLDELEVKAHATLFKGADVRVAEHPSRGNCRCVDGNLRTGPVLSPLGGFVGEDFLPEDFLNSFLRDMRVVLSKTGVDEVHLRLHPRETGKWPYQLKGYLIREGISTHVVASDCALREIVCDYSVVAGYCSNALRDVRASCDHIPVIGFVEFSRERFPSCTPQFSYGTAEGIGWIEEDGSFDPGIFQAQTLNRRPHPSINQILRDLLSREGEKKVLLTT